MLAIRDTVFSNLGFTIENTVKYDSWEFKSAVEYLTYKSMAQVPHT